MREAIIPRRVSKTERAKNWVAYLNIRSSALCLLAMLKTSGFITLLFKAASMNQTLLNKISPSRSRADFKKSNRRITWC